MGKIRQKKIRWDPSPSPDVTHYRIYWSEGETVDYGSAHAVVRDVGELLLPADLLPSFPLIKSTICLGISAVDRAGNESDITTVRVELDFTVPDAPSGLRVDDLQPPLAPPRGLRVEDL